MNENGKHKSIEDLFRDKLGNRDYPVSDGFWQGFSRKLRFREFMQFRPGSFNIYYLVTVAAAAAITISVLVGNQEEKPAKSPDPVINDDTITAPANRPDIKEKETNTTGVVTDRAKVAEDKLEKESDKPVNDADPGERPEPVEGSETAAGLEIESPVRLTIDRGLDAKNIVLPAPIAKFTPDRIEGCAPYTIHFKNLSHNYDSCIWEFDDGGLSNEKNPVWVYDEPGEYEVRLIIFGQNEERAVSKGKVIVHGNPEARFEISKGNPYIPDEEVRFYNYSQNAVKWKWDFGDGNVSEEFEPGHFYEKPGSYTVTLTAISEYGCIDSMVITNAFGDNTCFIRFPNAFVPNEGGPTGGYYSARSDEQEEVFHPVYSGVTSYNLRIYSRKGLLVFETDEIEIGWDGYYKGQKAEPGVYIWKVRGVYKNGEPFVKGGDVTLLPKW